jgi:hypothetical protein
VLSKETYVYLLNMFVAPKLKFKDVDLEYFRLIPQPHNTVRFLDHTAHQEVPELFCQQELRGLVDKTTA